MGKLFAEFRPTIEIAVIMAAGMGTRMRPLTDEVAKPLVRVNGKVLIESVIDGLKYRGVSRIYIVTGYKREQFLYLIEKYNNLIIVNNDEYDVKNNIASIYRVCNKIAENNCFICEADILVKDKSIFDVRFEKSCYFGKRVDGYSDDWVLEQDGNGRITRVGKGGTDTFNMAGIAYLQAKDTSILSKLICMAYFGKGNEALFWDDIVDRNLDKLDLTVHEVSSDQIVEIDTIEELAAIDSSYRKYLQGKDESDES
jgi:CTP:phosphocholine cytidylyltransferase involved in choline phosphorylation for cell surface LPS epitopes